MSVLIIAELSANHNNDFQLACDTVKAAAEAGADAIKLQTFRPESLALNVDNAIFGPKQDGPWKGWRPWDLYAQAAMPYDWQPKLKALAESLGMECFSSPFDLAAVDFLETLDVPRYKIASFEINDLPLIAKAAQMGKPMILSTGVASEADILAALDTCHQHGCFDITLLKCTSEYPATFAQANLTKLTDLKTRFADYAVKVGLSDHSAGDLLPVMSVALGAEVIEKHLILSRELGGLDSHFSMEPTEFAQMVQRVRQAQSALGEVRYTVNEKDQARKRSLFVVKPLSAGEAITESHLRSLRPCVGLEPNCLAQVVGQKVTRDLAVGEPLQWADLE